jgi:hypothetical protein
MHTEVDTAEEGVGNDAPFLEKKPMAVALLTTEQVLSILLDAVSKGCYVEQDKSAGTAKAYHSGVVMFQAFQKGKDGPWICRFVNTEHIAGTGTTTT